ncbi:MAG: flagellar basal body rod protein FlgB [Kineosporiaceae bacterium]
MLEDVSVDALHAALRGLAERQRAVSDNVANVNTPYFRARRVAFEGSLRSAVSDGTPAAARSQVFATQDPVGLNENNVDLNAETVLGIKTELAYELALRATGDRFALVRTAVKGS